MSERPSSELPPVDPELFERARDAVQALRGRGRQTDGRAGAGNTLNLRHGLHSTQLLQQPDIAAWHQDQVQAIEADLGGDSEMSTLARAAVREAARLEVVLAALGDELLQRGTLTGKGKSRAATAVYLKTFDRFMKVIGVLGLRRVPRRVPSLDEVLSGHVDG